MVVVLVVLVVVVVAVVVAVAVLIGKCDFQGDCTCKEMSSTQKRAGRLWQYSSKIYQTRKQNVATVYMYTYTYIHI